MTAQCLLLTPRACAAYAEWLAGGPPIAWPPPAPGFGSEREG